MRSALVDCEQALPLSRVGRNGDDELVEDRQGPVDDVEVAVVNGSKLPG